MHLPQLAGINDTNLAVLDVALDYRSSSESMVDKFSNRDVNTKGTLGEALLHIAVRHS